MQTLTLPGLQPLTAERARLCIPHTQLAAFMEETEAARKYVLDWIGFLEPLRHAKGRTRLFGEVARRVGDKPGNVKRHFYDWVDGLKGKHDPVWEGLIDRKRFPRPGDKALPLLFIEHWRGLRERQRRLNDGGRQAHRDLVSQLAEWEARPHDPALAIPGYKSPPPRDSYCSDRRCRVPVGWSYSNLSRFMPRKVQLVNVIVGPKAASALLPSNLATRAGLLYRQILFSDDQEYDNRITSFYTRGEMLKPQGFNVLDYLTGRFETRSIQFRRRDEDGAQRGINQELYVWTILGDLVANGFRDDDRGTVLVREHATAKGYAKKDGYGSSFDDILYHLTGGRVRSDASGRFDQPMFAQMFFPGRGKQASGNFRYKAPLESAFHAVRTRSAGLLGDTGNRYQVQPESADAIATYERKLFRAIDKLSAADRHLVYDLLRHTVHSQTEFARLVHLVYGALNNRRDHDLEGWAECGFVVPACEYPVPGSDRPGLATREQFAGMSGEQQRYVETFGKWRSLVLTPEEARGLCLSRDQDIRKLAWEDAVSAIPVSWAYPRRRGKDGGVKVNARGEIVIRDPDRFGTKSLVYLAVVHRRDGRIHLRPGEQVLVHVCPFAPDEALALDLQGRFRGVIKLNPRVCAADTEARLRNQGMLDEYAADLRRDSERRAEPEIQRQRDIIDHNDRVLSGEIRPDAGDAARARFQAAHDAADEAEERGIVSVRPETPHHAPVTPSNRYANIFANNPDLDDTDP